MHYDYLILNYEVIIIQVWGTSIYMHTHIGTYIYLIRGMGQARARARGGAGGWGRDANVRYKVYVWQYVYECLVAVTGFANNYVFAVLHPQDPWEPKTHVVPRCGPFCSFSSSCEAAPRTNALERAVTPEQLRLRRSPRRRIRSRCGVTARVKTDDLRK